MFLNYFLVSNLVLVLYITYSCIQKYIFYQIFFSFLLPQLQYMENLIKGKLTAEKHPCRKAESEKRAVSNPAIFFINLVKTRQFC